MEEINVNIIQTFESIFDEMEIDVSYEASIYYIILIYYAPVSFTELYRKARQVRRSISERSLKHGREALMKNGLIAQILLTHDSDVKFGTESYVPVNPNIIFEIYEEYLESIYSDEDFSIRKKYAEEIYENYIENFGKYGIKVKCGCVTLYYSNTWIQYNLLNIMKELGSDTLSMLGDFDFLKEPYKAHYDRMMQQGMKIRAIYSIRKEAGGVEELKKKYEDRVRIKYTPIEHYETCRQIIFDNEIAMDGKKLLPLDRPEPSYISTMYIKEEDSIALLKKNFESVWNASH